MKKMKDISSQNLSEAIDYAYAFNKKKTGAVLIRKVIVPLGSLVFAIHSLLLIIGIYLSTLSPQQLLAFGGFRCILTYSRSITDVNVILSLIYAYLIPFALSGLAALIISRITRVEEPMLSGTVAEKAKQLYDYTCTFPTPDTDNEDTHKLWRRISGGIFVSGLVAFVVYAAYTLSDSKDAALETSHKLDLLWGIIGILIAIVVLYLIYALLHLLFTLTIRCFYATADEVNTFSKSARTYWISVDPTEKKKAEEAAKIQQEKKKNKSQTSSFSNRDLPIYKHYYEQAQIRSGSASYRNNGKSLSHADKMDYIDKNCSGTFSFSGIETIEKDPSLTYSQKEDLKSFLKIYGD